MLNEDQYLRVCEACDRLLLAEDVTTERIAISWLHVIREHPLCLRSYVELFNGQQPTAYNLWRVKLRQGAGTMNRTAGAILRGRRRWTGPDKLPGTVDVLFVSHLVNAAHAGSREDFYYGSLPINLAEQGYSCIVALIDHGNQHVDSVIAKWSSNCAVPRVVFSDLCDIRTEQTLKHRLFEESKRLKEYARHTELPFQRRVAERAAVEARRERSIWNLRLANQIEELVTLIQPKAIVVTHEGHAWERLAFAAARRAQPSIECIGYVHSALFRLQHGVQRKLASRYNPNRILTGGQVVTERLKRRQALSGIDIGILGSPRSVERNGKERDDLLGMLVDGNPQPPACLVLPEGISSECEVLFDFSLACAQALPDIDFIWRLHPVMSFTALQRDYPKFSSLPKNVKLSNRPLAEDIMRSGWVLYRGTTAVMNAVMAGLRPLYLRLPSEMTIDPLFELERWRTMVEVPSDLTKVLLNDLGGAMETEKADLEAARTYCESYFTPLQTDAFTAMLDKVYG